MRPSTTDSRRTNIGANIGNQYPLNAALVINEWMPALSPNLQQKEFGKCNVIRGKNFRWAVDGVESGWGSEAITPSVVDDSALKYPIKSFRIEDRTVLVVMGKVLTLDSKCGKLRTLFTFNWATTHSEADYYPWTSALVGGIYYFSHPMSGMIYYDPHNSIWGAYQLDAKCFTSPIYGINDANNRLIVLLKDTVNWSEIDNAFNLDCDVYNGAGFQNLSLLGGGLPLGVTKTNAGFLTFTTRGIMNSQELTPKQVSQALEFNGLTNELGVKSAIQTFTADKLKSDAQFNHTVHTTDITAINPHCIVQMPGKQTLFLSKRGFYSIDEKTKPDEEESANWETLMGVYIAEKELRPVFADNFDNNDAIPHKTASDLREINSIRMEYDWQHGELFISFKERFTPIYYRALVFQFSYNKWASFDQLHYCFIDTTFNLHAHRNAKSYGFITDMGGVQQFNQNAFINKVTAEELGIEACPRYKEQLNSFVEIGMFKQNDFKYHDRLTRVTDVALTHGNILGVNSLDAWNHTSYSEQNWRELPHIERNNRFGVALSGSADAHNFYDNATEHLTMNQSYNNATHYAVELTAKMFFIRIYTAAIGDYFQINSIYLTGRVAGRE